MNQVEGFKAGRIERLSSKEEEELVERLLPYSIALGMKNRWAAVFGDRMNPVLPGNRR